jgi:hypothetical protein
MTEIHNPKYRGFNIDDELMKDVLPAHSCLERRCCVVISGSDLGEWPGARYTTSGYSNNRYIARESPRKDFFNSEDISIEYNHSQDSVSRSLKRSAQSSHRLG